MAFSSPGFLEYLELAVKSSGSWARSDPVRLHARLTGGLASGMPLQTHAGEAVLQEV